MKRKTQIEESKRMIYIALSELLKKKDVHAITFAEIAAKAGLTRMTLYRHFKSKEEIILYRAKEIYLQMKALNHPTNLELEISSKLQLLKTLPHVELINNNNYIQGIINDLRTEANESNFAFYVRGYPGLNDPYFLAFFMGGFNNIIKKWIDNKCQEPVELITSKILFILQLINSNLKSKN